MAEATATPVPLALDAMEHETLGDRQVRDLIERYVTVSGATLSELGPHLFELNVPPGDRVPFNNKAVIRLAFSVEAMQTDGDAEMAIMGGVFLGQLIDAIRSRGARRQAGFIGESRADGVEHPRLPVTVSRGSAGTATSRFERHRLGRLTARIVIRAGTTVHELLVDSDVFDTASGVRMSAAIGAECGKRLVGPAVPVTEAIQAIPLASSRKPKELIGQMLSNLEESVRPTIEQLRANSARELSHESGRIQRYYQTLLDDMGGRGTDLPDKESRRVFEAERDRRIAEERERHEVRATVHPVQLTEWDVLVQQVDWPIQATDGHHGTFSGLRVLAGSKDWVLACPTCAAQSPQTLAVCTHDHVACANCAKDCSVCRSAFCRSHGIATCHVDKAPACAEHARTCSSCLRAHCTAHEGECSDGGHPVCVHCLGACANCGRQVCDSHAEHSLDTAPRGARRFCHDCARTCEGGSNEIVGPDEVTGCASCERTVCEHHQARCAVDGKVHCSKHLRRTDRSRRLVCEKDRASCDYEPQAVFATDEVSLCTTCARRGCSEHVLPCLEDSKLHCRAHLVELRDRAGQMACEAHHCICHVDGGTYSLAGTKACPACGKRSCREHAKECVTCHRSVCVSDSTAMGICSTCSRLADTTDPSDEILAAANRLFESAGKAKAWRTARDAEHTIVEADLGWTRKVTFVLRHGEQKAERAFSKSVLGIRKLDT